MRRLKVFWDRSNYERNKGKLFLNEMTVLFAFLQYQKSYLNCATHFFNFPPVSKSLLEVPQEQCDQIGRFFALWATFQSLWQQLVCPNLQHYLTIFVKVSKSLIFLVKSFLGNFCTHLAIFYRSH